MKTSNLLIFTLMLIVLLPTVFATYAAPTGLESGEQFEESWTLSVLVPNNTVTCTLVDGGQGLWTTDTDMTFTKNLATPAESTCSDTYTNAPGGIYTYYITGANATDTANSALATVEIVPENPSAGYTAQQKANAQEPTMSPIMLLGGLLIILWLVTR